MRVVAALSGGVDSSVAAALLVEAGHDVTGVFLRNGVVAGPAATRSRQGCCSIGDAGDAARVAEILGVPFYALDFAAEFGAIVRDFADAYAAGRTPNPCIDCNRDLKFGRLLGFAAAIGAEAVATGHYAAVEGRGGRLALVRAADAAKDQTYVLFPLSQTQLARTIFPLAKLTKDEVRRIAAARGLPTASKPESMEICFVPGGDYRAVVAEHRPDALVAGDIVDARTGAVVGRHGGIGSVTIGQRRGVGVSGPDPTYVVGIDAATNRVAVGPADALLARTAIAAAWNGVACDVPCDGESLRGRVRVRRNHEPVPATVTGAGGSRVRIDFDDPVRAVAPGQAAVLYDDDGGVLGGGWIESAR